MRWRFVASSHTLSPTFQGEKFRVFCSFMIRQAVSCAAKASFQASSRVVKRFSRAGRKVFPRGGYALGLLRGRYPSTRERLVRSCPMGGAHKETQCPLKRLSKTKGTSGS